MRKRIALLLTALMLALTMVAGPVASGALAAPECEPGAPGCKTGDDPDKNNPKFLETQRGNLNARGTEDTERDCKVFGGAHEGEIRCR